MIRPRRPEPDVSSSGAGPRDDASLPCPCVRESESLWATCRWPARTGTSCAAGDLEPRRRAAGVRVVALGFRSWARAPCQRGERVLNLSRRTTPDRGQAGWIDTNARLPPDSQSLPVLQPAAPRSVLKFSAHKEKNQRIDTAAVCSTAEGSECIKAIWDFSREAKSMLCGR
jgi:hypothetical protein